MRYHLCAGGGEEGRRSLLTGAPAGAVPGCGFLLYEVNDRSRNVQKNMLLSCVAAALVLSTGLSCNDASGPSEVAAVLIVGTDRSVTIGQSIQFEGRAATTQAIRVDELVTWSVSDEGIVGLTAAMVDVGGRMANIATVTGLTPGVVDLTARAGSESHSVTITSVASSEPAF
jgi:hypothetical protein